MKNLWLSCSLFVIALIGFSLPAHALKVFPTGDDFSKMGTFADKTAGKTSSIAFAKIQDPDQDTVLKVDYVLDQSSWCGLYRSGLNQDWSKIADLKVSIKGVDKSAIRISFQDANKVSYIADMANITSQWQQIKVPVNSFKKNPYYQAPDSKQGEPMALQQVMQLQFEPQTPGKGSFFVGPITGE